MRNIWTIFTRDIRKIRTNVIALIVVLGVTCMVQHCGKLGSLWEYEESEGCRSKRR